MSCLAAEVGFFFVEMIITRASGSCRSGVVAGSALDLPLNQQYVTGCWGPPAPDPRVERGDHVLNFPGSGRRRNLFSLKQLF
ncbi:hypothetical protein TNCV_4885641 [Trichonephila clavipes]|uniref:Uncharacterized protein n=1 Tax=Trichonephila clavipes TaxID=2585209 RepID=A0A8X6V1F0_TRICX|nr:hypothetical protein TNCV_4885641 [Trichonephila clavipes]